jgi:hypothetical protein
MDRNDQRAIESLLEKLDNVERQAPPRDPDAENCTSEQIARQPGAPSTRSKCGMRALIGRIQLALESLQEQFVQVRNS